jgi:membrane-bound lytic murein transglycosylase MltF
VIKLAVRADNRIHAGTRARSHNTTHAIIGLLLSAICIVIWSGTVTPASAQEEVDSLPDIFPDIFAETSTGDLPAMKARKLIRVLVTPSRTDFFIYNGQPKGLQVELLEQYEKFLNKGVSRRELRTRIAYVPVPFSDLIPALNEGRGDLAAALLTITPAREEQVEFISGRRWTVEEILVTHKSVEDINNLFDLAGRSIHVLRGSSYAEHLREINERFLVRRLPPIEIVEADAHLLSEDILELVNAGVIEMTVIDDFKADLWAKIFPDAVVRNDIQINAGGTVGWAIRRDNPELEASIMAFLPGVRRGSLLGNMITERYFGTTEWINNPLDESEREKLELFMHLFREYGDQYGFDWMAVVAQAYQESGLDHSAKSDAGAVGIMQLLPSTAKYVGFPEVTELEDNIHAGVKYLAYLREKYFSGPEFAKIDRFAFTWAAYNAGPTNVRRMRSRAVKMNLDPDVWFQNVEYAALRIVGQETVKYVSNIYKYYMAYSLSRELLDERFEQIQSIKSSE